MSGTTTMRNRYQPNSFTSEQVREFWDSVADEYVHEGESIEAAHFQRFDRAFTYFEPHDDMSALNVWSRNGEAIDYFRRCAPRMRVVNAEISPRLIEKARQKYPDEQFVETDLMNLAFRDAEFDLVLSLETLEHAPDPLQFVRELYRVLKPGGRLVMSCPPATAEPLLRVYEFFFRNHGEGPHRFLPSREVKALLHLAGFELKIHDSTLFIPAGPRFVRCLEPWVERLLGRTPLGEMGIRQFFVSEKPLGAGPWQELLRDVVEAGLCTRCGTCAGVCPSSVFQFIDVDEACLPAALDPQLCTQCGLCVAGCPGAHVSFADLHASVGLQKGTGPICRNGRKGALHELGLSPFPGHAFGPFRRIRVARASDRTIQTAGASGGVVTGLLCELLNRGGITGAVVLDSHPEAPWRPWPKIVRTPDEVLRAAQSKYCVTPTNVWLQDAQLASERLAVVALPCQVHALRKLERRGHPALGAVSLIIGLFCGNQLHFGATRSFLRRHGVRDLQKVAEVRYRDGSWPGNVRCTLTDGSSFSVPKFHFNQLISSYVVERCLLCADLAAEGADISVGDAWDKRREQEGDGRSLVISRTLRGESMVAGAVARGVLEADEIDVDHAVRMHAHGLDLKKTGALLRIDWRTRKGKPFPAYDLPIPRVPLRRRLVEVLLGAHFALCRTRLARWLADRMPFGLLGQIYDVARVVWRTAAKKGSAPICRNGLKGASHKLDLTPFSFSLRDIWNFVCLPLRMVASPEILHRLGLRSMKDERLKAVLRECRGRLLDVGCGPDNELVRRYAGEGVGVDVFPWPGIDRVCDTRQMPLDDGVFDTVTIVAALNHITDRGAVLRECRRLLAPDGRLVLTMIGPVVGWVRHRVTAWWDPDQRQRAHAPGELDGMTGRYVRELLEKAGFQLELDKTFVCGLNHLYVARPQPDRIPAASNSQPSGGDQKGQPPEE